MPRESKDAKQKRARSVLRTLRRTYADADMMLVYSNHWELLVSVMLSAQCTDKMVNRVTADLFKKYKTIDDYIAADPREFEKDIHSTGFYRSKTKNVLAAARMLKERFGGELPHTLEEMIQLPGVARKTANVVLGNAYGVVEGIAVDTHVKRLSNRLGFSANTNTDKIEQDLMGLVPQKEWFDTTYTLIEHGRAICDARAPRCDECPVKKLCPSAFQFPRFENRK